MEATGSTSFIKDNNLTGSAIKVTAKGKATFVVKIRIKGETSALRHSMGNVNDYTFKDALEEAHLIIANARLGYDPRYTKEDISPKSQSLRYHLEDYLKKKDFRPNSTETYCNQCNSAFEDCYKILVDAITSEMIAYKRLVLIKTTIQTKLHHALEHYVQYSK